MERFEGAYQMTYNLKKKNKKLQVIDKNMKKPTRKDLVFLDESPDYCERNQTYRNPFLSVIPLNHFTNQPRYLPLLSFTLNYDNMVSIFDHAV